MGLIQAFAGSVGGVLADQWKDVITAGYFDEHTVVTPGVFKQTNNGRGSNTKGSQGVISNGSKILVPENTAAFVFSQSGIETIVTKPGGYEYLNGQSSVFHGDGVGAIFSQISDRFGYGGQPGELKQVAFVNLREIRDIKFGTRAPLLYHDMFYDSDLEILSFGSFTVKIVDAVTFIRNYLPPNIYFYSFDAPEACSQIVSEFIQSFMVALNSLSSQYRISQLPSQVNEVAQRIAADKSNAGTWRERFGFEVVKVGIENIEFSEDSRELVKQFSANKMNVKAYDNVSQRTSNIAAQQAIAQGVQQHGLGDGAGLVLGMNMAQQAVQSAQPSTASSTLSLDQQIEMLQKLKSLLDAGILSQEEFETKKREIMGL